MSAPARSRQSGRSQFVDAAVLLVLLFTTLFVTTWIVERTSADTGGGDTEAVKSVDELPISGAERAQYQRMIDQGLVDEATVNQQVADNAPSKDKYPINPVLLLATALLLLGYLAFVYRVSFKEYREVIEHKFDRLDGRS
ncbi:MAG: hypothetical protein GEV07_11015 [Streptosporangiales bacterium]|nr:hypothetical protein [Streptosporangiales bacterium]